MKATILSLAPTEWAGLAPTPNVTESAYISDKIASQPRTTVGLTEGPLSIYASYRGTLLYLENGASIYRMNPPEWCNGHASGPDGPEACLVSHDGEWFTAKVEFGA